MHPGCYERTPDRYCSQHTQEQSRRSDEARPSAAMRLYDRWWRRESKLFLRKNPKCVDCEADGRTEAATIVDHVIPHRGDRELFRDRSNWQGLCKPHHDTKTARGE